MNMKHLQGLRLAFLLWVFTICSLFAQQSLLWEISGGDLDQPSYLFGTIHMSCEFDLSDRLESAIKSTEQLYLEVKLDDPNLQMEMMKGMLTIDGSKMSAVLDGNQFERLDAFLKEHLGMSIKMFDQTKPLLIQSMMYPKILDCPMVSMETELMSIYKEQKKSIHGLETIAEQMSVFDKIPYQTQLDQLLKMANGDLSEEREQFRELIHYYQNEDLKMLMKAFHADGFTAEFANLLLDVRNRNWIRPMHKAMKTKPTLFAVGAAHLAGENGVIQLLTNEGFVLTPIMN